MLLRTAFLVGFALISMAARAEDWGRYVSESYGFGVDVPPGFAVTHADAEVRTHVSADGTREILILAGNSFEPLERLVERHMAYDEQDGWRTRLLSSTPSWATYAGSRNGMLTAVRMIEICPRWQYARLKVIYPERDAVAISPLLDRIGPSLRATGAAACPER